MSQLINIFDFVFQIVSHSLLPVLSLNPSLSFCDFQVAGFTGLDHYAKMEQRRSIGEHVSYTWYS
jgi:hypothetical protein